MATEFKDLGKNLTKVYEDMAKALPVIEKVSLTAGIADFKLRVFSDASKDVNERPLGFYKSNYYKTEVKEKLRNTIDLQLTDQLKDSIQVGVDSKRQQAIGYASNLVRRQNEKAQGGQTIKARGLTNPRLGEFIDKEFGETIAFNENEATTVQKIYDREFLKVFNKSMDRVF